MWAMVSRYLWRMVGQIAEVDTAVCGLLVPLAAVDRYLVAALHQARGELFGEGFETAVAARECRGCRGWRFVTSCLALIRRAAFCRDESARLTASAPAG